ncbi:hypothetical protein B0J14DRAFT_653848 [Halenospora varia]|nr:hypothetical protein B0J14DRAFT_653848 [Halenospora varia]
MPREHHKAWNATTRLASFERHSRRLQKELNKSLEVHSEKETKNEPGEEVSKTQHSATPHRKMLRDEEDEATRKVRYLEFVLSHPKTPENISAKLVDNIKSIRRDIADRDRLYARALQVLEARFWNYGGYMRGVPNEVREKLKRGCQRLVKWENVDVLVEWAIEGWEYEGASAGCAGRADSVEVEIKEEDMEVKIKKEDVA